MTVSVYKVDLYKVAYVSLHRIIIVKQLVETIGKWEQVW